jgi:TrpR-related protein YerC/YecD
MSIKKDPKFDALFKAILALESIDEAYDFFDDLCTMAEVSEMRDRFEVAGLLLEGKTYAQIENETNMSSATISRVNRCIQYGPGAYRLAHHRIKPKRA